MNDFDQDSFNDGAPENNSAEGQEQWTNPEGSTQGHDSHDEHGQGDQQDQGLEEHVEPELGESEHGESEPVQDEHVEPEHGESEHGESEPVQDEHVEPELAEADAQAGEHPVPEPGEESPTSAETFVTIDESADEPAPVGRPAMSRPTSNRSRTSRLAKAAALSRQNALMPEVVRPIREFASESRVLTAGVRVSVGPNGRARAEAARLAAAARAAAERAKQPAVQARAAAAAGSEKLRSVAAGQFEAAAAQARNRRDHVLSSAAEHAQDARSRATGRLGALLPDITALRLRISDAIRPNVEQVRARVEVIDLREPVAHAASRVREVPSELRDDVDRLTASASGAWASMPGRAHGIAHEARTRVENLDLHEPVQAVRDRAATIPGHDLTGRVRELPKDLAELATEARQAASSVLAKARNGDQA